MGLMDKILGGTPDYPPLPEEAEGAQRIDSVRAPLTSVAEKLAERLEVVAAGETTYVLFGKPPKKFGVSWIRDGDVTHMKDVVDEQGVSPIRLERIESELRDAYEKSGDAERYLTELGGQDVVVTHSQQLHDDIDEIVRRELGG